MEMNDIEMLPLARYYAKLGLRVLPVMPGKKAPPLIGDWPNLASTSTDTVTGWWTQHPLANIAVATGDESGVVDIETDRHGDEDGETVLAAWGEKNGPLPATWAFRSGGGGVHRLFRYTGGEIKNRAGLLPAVDVRGKNGYAIVPPSIHPSGNRYEWIDGCAPEDMPKGPAPLPDALLRLITAGGQKQQIALTGKIPAGQRNATLFELARRLYGEGKAADTVLAAICAENDTRAMPPLGKKEIETICIQAEKYATVGVKPPDFSDAGNAEAFRVLADDKLRFCDALGWLAWDGERWTPDDHAAIQTAKDFTWAMLEEAKRNYERAVHGLADEQVLAVEAGKTDAFETARTAAKNAKAYLSHAERSRSANSIRNMLELSKPALVVKADKLDADPFILNTAAGIVDLRTGEIRPHDRAALCTRIAPFAPAEEGRQNWIDFLRLVTDGDDSLAGYLQMCAGMCSIGKVLVEGILLAIGGGRNGKSTFFNTLASVLGDYAGGINAQVLTTERQNRGAALATLRGRRLVTCGELEEGQRLSVATLKSLASTDPLTVEEKFRAPETVKPTHHICLFSNFLPRVGSTDGGTWRRLTVIPFNAIMPSGRAEIKDYSAKLAEEAGGAILAWIIEGARLFISNGCRLDDPDAVQEATDAYRQREDWMQTFLSEKCTRGPGKSVRAGVLYTAYKDFANESGDYCRRLTEFNAALETAGFRSSSSHRQKTWIGLEINGYQAAESPLLSSVPPF